ncbi:thiamine/thiamine pyrophosphate ABC transporter permease [Hoeflea prorocentri]|uniref:Thiamine transport system permease protein ThiP n=1 Tax=Hoeflea prorocentri TaxID=1922333 RepID=A0A9X3UMS7_9HYPH|nr:thiamine/thiamine pyrophosphate ABC transporter permease [Hoeflea prorocentri]MCY6383557.1 thiamine/thiamine pyrophosphate ABC transporter permease [Hoeflea prorocentri]MDA5401357.1 thiamine/thiamine pyrophosphate ABC transporter permease [Hoeflea prorocentri]
MLGRRQTVTGIGAGIFVLCVMAGVIGAAVLALMGAAATFETTGSALFSSYIWKVTQFTLLQACLSTVLSVGLAIPLARALARRQSFPGRRWLVRLLAVPIGLPPIVAALGIIEIWGRQGIINSALLSAGMSEPVSIYGLAGILIAHVFFNMPLATRLLLAQLDRVPPEYWRNASQLGLGSWTVFRLIEWPFMRSNLAPVCGLIFMLCVTSFTLVLLLGGGPAATTIEVAIYQALRFDFDPQRAVALALIQLTLTSVLLAMLALMGGSPSEGGTSGQASQRFPAKGSASLITDFSLICVSALFLLSPLVSVAVSGLLADFTQLLNEAIVWRAIATSLAIALAAALISITMGLCLIRARYAALPFASRHAWARLFRFSTTGASSLVLLVPPIVLGAGWFVLLRSHVDVFAMAPVIVIAVNALMALPFVMRVLEPAHTTHMARTAKLVQSLGIAGINRLVLVDWPGLRRSLLLAMAFAMALSLGDLGAIALFGSQDVITLPYLLLQRMGSYRTSDAAGLALLLGLVCLVLMILADRGRTNSHGSEL